MPNWLKKLKEKIEEVEQSPTGVMEICKIKDVPANLFDFLSDNEAKKIRIRDGNIILVANESNVHQAGVQACGMSLALSPYCQRRNLGHLTKPYFIVVNQFKCGQLAKKIPDVLFGPPSKIPTLALELAFMNEDIDELYWESVHSLTEFTTIEIAIGVKIFYHEENNRFDALIYAMRRVGDNTSSILNEQPRIVLQRFRQNGIVENYHCRSKEQDFPAGDFRQQSRLGVEIFFEHRINDQNYLEDITITIEYPDDIIVIRGEFISYLRRNYRSWWHERNSAGANQ